ncbi:MAG: hypothetical protein DRR04_00685 [Gammaproteobacteria bacterium]|nr:MAG: hypothetical protein DRQ97_00150 [Gammaproteobacteria bacterium]RLA62240.1 MAG: hypothetical protein DRR04_00685 [Gammaproteobacteria bacterium]
MNRATHLSIAWAVALAIITLVEWNSLDRDPLGQEIFLPFISREISLNTIDASDPGPLDFSTGSDAATAGGLQYEVEFFFNGPLFLAYFFGPVLFIQGGGLLLARIKRG